MNANEIREKEIDRLEDFDNIYGDLSKYARNLNLLALEGKLGAVHNRDDALTAVQKILLRHTKPNVLLTGAAGCGKTAIVEGLAQRIVEIRLAYLEKVSAAEGCSNMGQILKPALARGDIRVIGATTTEEVKILRKDKALDRRFSDVPVSQLTGRAAIERLKKIMADYAKYHDVQIVGVDAASLYNAITAVMPESVFPNNAIDVVDEALASAKFDGKDAIGCRELSDALSRIVAANR